MSGPKVVRIVTREEIVAICERHLRRLEHAFARWERLARRMGELETAELEAVRARHARLRGLLQDDRLVELQKEVPLEIGFLAGDIERREEQAVARAARERGSQRRLRENAAALLRALEGSAGPPVAGTLLEALQAIASGRALADAGARLAEGHAHLGRIVAGESLDAAQRRLASALQVERPQRWLAAEQAAAEPRLERIDQHIARLRMVHGTEAAAPFLPRLEAIEGEPTGARRDLLLDSLVVEVAAAVAEREARRAALVALQALASELEALPAPSVAGLKARVEACLQSPAPDSAEVAGLARECGEAIEEALRQHAAVSRRQAVLEGLAGLGYEVREGMETAWADSGSVVLRKTATPGYGVEVGGRAEGGRLQVRAVSLSEANDRARERDIETIWCGEFKRLRALLAEQGGELVVEKALAVGEVPLKVVAGDADAARDVAAGMRVDPDRRL